MTASEIVHKLLDEGIKDEMLDTHWSSDPADTLKRLGFKETRPMVFKKWLPLPAPFVRAATREGDLPSRKFINGAVGEDDLFSDPERSEEATTAMIKVTGESGERANSYGREADPWHPREWLTVGLYIGGWAANQRKITSSRSAGDLSTRLMRVTGDLERAIQEVDPGRFDNFWDYERELNRVWGKQPNRIVKPFKRKK